MSDQNLPADDEEGWNKLLTEICLKLEAEARMKLGLKIPRFQVYAYNAQSSCELTGEVIFSARASFLEKCAQYWKLIVGEFDYRNHSTVTRPLSDNEKILLDKFIFNFCCLNSLKYKTTDLVVRTDLLEPYAIMYRIEMLDDLFLVHDKI